MPQRVLIVDDDHLLLQALSRQLKSVPDYEFFTASDQENILAIIAENAIDILVTDILMPEKDGIQLLEEVQEQFPQLKLIAMSGGGRIEGEAYLEMASNLGSSYSLLKPFSRKDFLSALGKVR